MGNKPCKLNSVNGSFGFTGCFAVRSFAAYSYYYYYYGTQNRITG